MDDPEYHNRKNFRSKEKEVFQYEIIKVGNSNTKIRKSAKL